jgi:hypothetical protein
MNSKYVIDSASPPRVKKAFEKFFKQLTPSHSLTSRRFSIFTLMREIIDPEINALVIAPTMSDLLPGIESFSVSDMWSESRPLDGIRELQIWIKATERLSATDSQLSFECDSQIKSLASLQTSARWDSFIKMHEVWQLIRQIKKHLQKSKQLIQFNQEGFILELSRHIYQIQTLIDVFQLTKNRSADYVNICEFNRRVISGSSWATYIHQAIRHLQLLRKNKSESLKMIGVLETLTSFITYCNALKPKRIRTPKGRHTLPFFEINLNREELIQNHEMPPWFELCTMCFRPTVFASNSKIASRKLQDNQIYYQSKITGSRNYCKFHDPKNPESEYRKDLKRKSAFLHEVDALSNNAKSNYKINLKPINQSNVEIRRAAYALVQSRLKGNRENVGLLLSQGVKQAEIARRLGISRQAVSKHKASIPKELELLHWTMWLLDAPEKISKVNYPFEQPNLLLEDEYIS